MKRGNTCELCKKEKATCYSEDFDLYLGKNCSKKSYAEVGIESKRTPKFLKDPIPKIEIKKIKQEHLTVRPKTKERFDIFQFEHNKELKSQDDVINYLLDHYIDKNE